MAELDELERSLALAQIGLAAPPGVKQRVRAKLGPEALPAAERVPVQRPGALSVAARWKIPTWGALALTGIGFVAGYLLGQRPTSKAEQPVAPMSVARTESPSAVSATPSNATESHGTPPSEEATPPRPESRVRARATRNTPAQGSLAAELALLTRSERAIRAGNSDLALALLDQLDRDFPKPQLQQEREAARLLAECERDGQGAATEHARQYLSRHPASVYSERIRTLCGLDGSEGSAPGGH